MPRPSNASVHWIAALGLFGFAVALGLLLARPIHSASIAFDSQVAVLDFDRLIAGRKVESFLSTTPKPLLTFIFGPLRLLTGDWRSVAWATLLAFGVGVALMAELARRVGGPIAWAFVGVGLAGSGALLFDVGYALAVPWAMLGWALAGLALCRPQPRYELAGIALMLATLARLESVLIVGLSAAILVAFELPPVARAAAGHSLGRPPRRAWLICLGFLAFPIMAVHDLLIYGDPLFWSTVAARYSALTSQHILNPGGVLHWLAGRYIRLWPLVLLGLVGLIRIIRKRAWVVLVGVTAMGPGMAAFLLYLSARHIVVPDRYAAPIDIAAIMAAGVGTAWLLEAGVERLGRRFEVEPRRARGLAAGALLGGVLLAGIATWPSGILDPELQGLVHNSLALAENLDEMDPILGQIVDQTPGAHSPPPNEPAAGAAPISPLLYVPQPYRPRMSVDLNLALPLLGSTISWVAPPGGHPVGIQYIAHDRHADVSSVLWQPYETLEPITYRGIRIVPIASNPARGWWISQVQSAPN